MSPHHDHPAGPLADPPPSGVADLTAAADYGDPSLWRQDATAVLAPGVDVGWRWLAEDDDPPAGAELARAADEALTTGEELLARDLQRLLDAGPGLD